MSATTEATSAANGVAHVTGDVLSLADAAAYLRVPEDAVREEANACRLPGRRIGGEWRFSRAGILAWLATPDPAVVPARGSLAEWLAVNPPRELDEAAERELHEELALMAKYRRESGPANPDVSADEWNATVTADAARKAS